MANAPDRLLTLNASAFQERLRCELLKVYGAWQAAAGTGLECAEWFGTLAEAIQAEAPDWPTAVELCRFAFVDRIVVSQPSWASDVLARPSVRTILSYTLASLSTVSVSTPAAAKAFFQEMRHALRRSQGFRGQEVMEAIRAALTGTQRGPCLGIVAALLGLARVQQRLQEQLACLPSS